MLNSSISLSSNRSPTFQLNTPTCEDNGFGIDFLIIVTSSAQNILARAAIRQTWGKHATERGSLLFFFLENSWKQFPSETFQQLAQESQTYGDLIFGKFSNKSQTQKSLQILRFLSDNCSRVRWAIKLPDTTFVNSPSLVDFCEGNSRLGTRSILGSLIANLTVRRTAKVRYFLPESVYPKAVLPDFLQGPVYLLYGDTIRPLTRALATTRQLEAYQDEDLLLTGILSQKAKINRKQESRIFNSKVPEINECNLSTFWTSLGHSPKEIIDLWDRIWSRKCLKD